VWRFGAVNELPITPLKVGISFGAHARYTIPNMDRGQWSGYNLSETGVEILPFHH